MDVINGAFFFCRPELFAWMSREMENGPLTDEGFASDYREPRQMTSICATGQKVMVRRNLFLGVAQRIFLA